MTDDEVTVGVLDAAIKMGEQNADLAIFYGSWLMRVRRRLRNAVALLEQGRVDAAKEMLLAALADDGKMSKRQLDKVVKRALDEHKGVGHEKLG